MNAFFIASSLIGLENAKSKSLNLVEGKNGTSELWKGSVNDIVHLTIDDT